MIRSDFCFGSRLKFLSAQCSPNCNRCISMLRDRDRCDDSISKQDPASIQEPIHRELVAEGVHGGVDEKTARGRQATIAAPRVFPTPGGQLPEALFASDKPAGTIPLLAHRVR